jgi:hypothetical protein
LTVLIVGLGSSEWSGESLDKLLGSDVDCGFHFFFSLGSGGKRGEGFFPHLLRLRGGQTHMNELGNNCVSTDEVGMTIIGNPHEVSRLSPSVVEIPLGTTLNNLDLTPAKLFTMVLRNDD